MKKISGKLIIVLTVLYFLFIMWILINIFTVGDQNSYYGGPGLAYAIYTLPTSYLVSVLGGDSWNIFFLFIMGTINTVFLYFLLRLLQLILTKIIIIIIAKSYFQQK